jgi:hypothetical protein
VTPRGHSDLGAATLIGPCGRWLLIAGFDGGLHLTTGALVALPAPWHPRALIARTTVDGPVVGTVAVAHLVLAILGWYLLAFATAGVLARVLAGWRPPRGVLPAAWVLRLSLPGTGRLVAWAIGIAAITTPVAVAAPSFAGTPGALAMPPPTMTNIGPTAAGPSATMPATTASSTTTVSPTTVPATTSPSTTVPATTSPSTTAAPPASVLAPTVASTAGPAAVPTSTTAGPAAVLPATTTVPAGTVPGDTSAPTMSLVPTGTALGATGQPSGAVAAGTARVRSTRSGASPPGSSSTPFTGAPAPPPSPAGPASPSSPPSPAGVASAGSRSAAVTTAGPASTGPASGAPPGPPPASPNLAPTSTSPGTWVVEPGDHLWSIAERTLAAAWGQAPGVRAVGAYWWQVVTVNRPTLPDPADIDLLFAGDVVTLPPIPPPAPPPPAS